MSGQQTRQWILSNPPAADPVLEGSDSTFSLQNTTLPTPGADQALVKTLYFSNDPAQRGWIQKGIDPERLYVPPVKQGEVMRSFGIAEVIESNTDALKKGQLVTGSLGWTEYAVVSSKEVRVVQADPSAGIRPTHHLGALGGTGLTAYYGIVDIARATKDDIVVVSGAAGATGSMVVQIAKHIIGCKKVIGIAGGAISRRPPTASYKSTSTTSAAKFSILCSRAWRATAVSQPVVLSRRTTPWARAVSRIGSRLLLTVLRLGDSLSLMRWRVARRLALLGN
jgi:NADPH-dependent curcumin reductase CurA